MQSSMSLGEADRRRFDYRGEVIRRSRKRWEILLLKMEQRVHEPTNAGRGTVEKLRRFFPGDDLGFSLTKSMLDF